MSQTPLTTTSLSPHWAFVVQLQEGAALDPEQLTGRVEHITSGQAMEVRSLAALVAFMAQVLHPPYLRAFVAFMMVADVEELGGKLSTAHRAVRHGPGVHRGLHVRQ